QSGKTRLNGVLRAVIALRGVGADQLRCGPRINADGVCALDVAGLVPDTDAINDTCYEVEVIAERISGKEVRGRDLSRDGDRAIGSRNDIGLGAVFPPDGPISQTRKPRLHRVLRAIIALSCIGTDKLRSGPGVDANSIGSANIARLVSDA